jgi:hypothetical protein
MAVPDTTVHIPSGRALLRGEIEDEGKEEEEAGVTRAPRGEDDWRPDLTGTEEEPSAAAAASASSTSSPVGACSSSAAAPTAPRRPLWRRRLYSVNLAAAVSARAGGGGAWRRRRWSSPRWPLLHLTSAVELLRASSAPSGRARTRGGEGGG